jgi:hypothetical protein
MIVSFYNFFLILFATDAVTTAINHLALNALSIDVFSGFSVLVSVCLWLVSILAYLGLGVFARIPVRTFLPATVFPSFVFLVTSVTSPFGPSTMSLAVCLVFQLLVLAWTLKCIREKSSSGGWLLESDSLQGRWFSLKRTLVFILVNTLVIPPAAVGFGVYSVASHIESASKGYVSIRSDGIYSTEKSFVKDGVELKLLGMAHVGDARFYDNIKESMAGKPVLMLMEGVSDDADLLETPPDYGFIAENLGVTDQREKFSPEHIPETVKIIRADVDVASFSASTIEALNLAGKLYTKDGFSLATFVEMQTVFSRPGVSQAFVGDLLTKRNSRLLEVLQQNLDEYERIVLPWGAMHLPEIEAWVIANGFVLKDEKARLVYSYSTLLN